MVRNVRRMKQAIQNVRVVDKDEGLDDVKVDRILQQLSQSESQIRVCCTLRQEIVPTATAGITTFDYATAASTDDFASVLAQYTEFRIRAMRFDVYDVQSTVSAINYMGTYHFGGSANLSSLEAIVDRADSRTLSPGQGKTSLSWVAHSIPEMEFQDVTSYTNLGGFSIYTSAQGTITGTKYQVVARFVCDFRGRR